MLLRRFYVTENAHGMPPRFAPGLSLHEISRAAPKPKNKGSKHLFLLHPFDQRTASLLFAFHWRSRPQN